MSSCCATLPDSPDEALLARHRLGVALLLDEPGSREVDGLRRALGDVSLERVAPHVTLVPPVNVRHDALEAALEVLRAAARHQPGPLLLKLGPPATFWPDSPVVLLGVSGDPEQLGRLYRLHDAVLSGPLYRAERWPWSPHVTLADGASEETISQAVACLSAYQVDVELTRVVLMEERDHQWVPLADACFGPPAIIGRGGLPLELIEGREVGPDALGLAAGPGQEMAAELLGSLVNAQRVKAQRVVISGRREGSTVGVAVAWLAPAPASPLQVGILVTPECRGQGVGRVLLSALLPAVERQGWCPLGAVGHGPAGFYQRSAGWVTSPG